MQDIIAPICRLVIDVVRIVRREMTDCLMRVIVLIATLACPPATLAMQVSDMAPCAPNAAHQIRTLESFLIVHVECSNVLLEIPPAILGRSILAYTEFAALSTGGSEYAPGSAIDSRVVRWAHFGSKVALLSVNYDNWGGDSAPMNRAIEAVSLPTVIHVFDVVKMGAGGAPIIDITALFTTEVPKGFALEFKRHYRMAHVDGQRSIVRSVRTYPKNVEIGYYQTWTPDEKDLLKPAEGQDPPAPSLGFAFKTNFLLLPEKPMATSFSAFTAREGAR